MAADAGCFPLDSRPERPYGWPMTIRALIVDDEEPARDELAFLLSAHPDVARRQAASASSALEAIAGGDVDVVFQDIQMPGQDGFSVLATAQGLPNPPLFVFVTAFDSHAIRAFEANALDYLLKPVSPERLARSLERVRERLDAGGGQPLRQAMSRLLAAMGRETPPADLPAQAPVSAAAPAASPIPVSPAPVPPAGAPALARLAVEQGGRIGLIPTARIILIEAEEKRVTALTDQGRLVCHGLPTLAKAEERLAGLPFFRANRAQLVNLERIAEFAPWFGGKYAVVMNDKDRTEVSVSRNRTRDFKLKLGI